MRSIAVRTLRNVSAESCGDRGPASWLEQSGEYVPPTVVPIWLYTSPVTCRTPSAAVGHPLKSPALHPSSSHSTPSYVVKGLKSPSKSVGHTTHGKGEMGTWHAHGGHMTLTYMSS